MTQTELLTLIPNVGGWSNAEKISVTIGQNFYAGFSEAVTSFDSKGVNPTELGFTLKSKSNASTFSNNYISGNLLEIRIPNEEYS